MRKVPKEGIRGGPVTGQAEESAERTLERNQRDRVPQLPAGHHQGPEQERAIEAVYRQCQAAAQEVPGEVHVGCRLVQAGFYRWFSSRAE